MNTAATRSAPQLAPSFKQPGWPLPHLAGLGAWLLRAKFAATLGVAIWLLWQMLIALPQRLVLQTATLRLQPGEAVVLGKQALAAPAADRQHLRVSRATDGTWGLQNISPDRALEVRRDGQDTLLRSTAMVSGQRLLLAGDAWAVEAHDPALVLRHVATGKRWVYEGALLQSADSGPAAACSDAGASSRVRHTWNTLAPGWMRWPAAMQWGGSVACLNHLPAAGMEPGALRVQRRAGRYWLQGRADDTRRVCLQGGRGEGCEPGASLYEQTVPLLGVSQLVLGRTGLAADVKGSTLTLRPLWRTGWLDVSAAAPQVAVTGRPGAAPARTASTAPPALAWQTARHDTWRWAWAVSPVLAAALVFAAAVAVAVVAHVRRWGLKPAAGLALGLSVAFSAASLWAFSVGSALGEGWSLALVSVAMVSTAVLPVRTGWAWLSHALVALMMAAGLALQLQLAAQSVDTGGWVYFQKTAVMAAGGLFAAQALAWWLHGLGRAGSRLQPPGVVTLELALVVPALAALVLLALQALLGGEEGVFGIQPVELAKLALVLLGAHVLALRMEWARQGGWRRWALWLRMVMPVALFLALGATALLLLNDFSPLLLMMGWLVGATLAWALAAGSWVAALLVVAAVAGAVQGVLWVQGDGLLWLQAHGFYADRFAVWLQPLLHPHSGEQVLRAMKVMAQGGWWGDALAPAWRVPAVQDDMAPAFFAGRFGVAAAGALLVVQLAYVGSLLMLGWQALAAAGPGDFRRRWGLRLVFFASWGAAALFVAHLLLSWGTNTGALPVMGQPMPLISAGGSVIALLIAPLQMLWLLQPALLRGQPAPAPGK